MAQLTGYDAAVPPATPPHTDVVAFYGGGDTPHVWTVQEIGEQSARYRLPIFVRSNPIGANVVTDVGNFVTYLRKIGCPPGSATVLDLETSVDPTYVAVFGDAMHSFNYKVLPYGSSSTLFRNPRLDGYWVDLPGARMIPSNCVAVQYSQGGSGRWDNDWFNASIPLWDTQPPPPVIKEDIIMPFVAGAVGTQGEWVIWPNGTKTLIDNVATVQVLLKQYNQTVVTMFPDQTFIDSLPGSTGTWG